MSKREDNPFPNAPVYNKQLKSGGAGHSSSTSAHMSSGLPASKGPRSKGKSSVNNGQKGL